jgi:hypothetical protein
MDVVKVIERVSRRVPAPFAFEILEAFKSRWYSYPRKQYDFDCWYPIIRALTKRLSEDSEQTQRWRNKHPKLLVAEQVKRSELAHVFGGDQSGRFSNAMTEVLQCTLRHHREIQHAAAKWEKRT